MYLTTAFGILLFMSCIAGLYYVAMLPTPKSPDEKEKES